MVVYGGIEIHCFLKKVALLNSAFFAAPLQFNMQARSITEDFLFPFGGLDFLFRAKSEGFGDLSLSNREFSLHSQTGAHTRTQNQRSHFQQSY